MEAVTEQPDTAAIRAACDEHGWYSAVIRDLCDALDAARADRDHKVSWAMGRAEHAEYQNGIALARAEAAEAELARVADDYAGLISRCKAAEARIAAAMDIVLGGHIVIGGGEYILRKEVSRALTGDTL